MVTMTITMDIKSEKRRELLQTLYELLPFLSKELGCCDIQVYVDHENLQRVTLLEVWESQKDMERYMRSNFFAVLRGAMQLLTHSSDITFSAIPQSLPMRAIRIDRYGEIVNIDECRVSLDE